MSNFLAIATVTAALRQTILPVVQSAVNGTEVTTRRPDDPTNADAAPRVNLYLYSVVPNAAWRNADLPTRRGDSTLAQRPQAALNLHYLLTFYGDEAQLQSQRLLGSTVSALHARPLLTREAIRKLIQTAQDPGDAYHFLAISDLAEQAEIVRFAPLSLDLEELSKLWSVFFQTPYTLSVVYQASVALIEGEEIPQAALPVRAPKLYVVPFRQPAIEQVVAEEGANQPIVAGSTLVIRGQRLQGDVTQVRIGGVEVEPASEDVSDVQISLPLSSLPAGSLRAGVQGVQVLHPMMMGDPLTLHRGVESNLAAFVLRPTVKDVAVSNLELEDGLISADVTVQVDTIVGKEQRVNFLLNELSSAEPAAYTFPVGSRESDSDLITIPVSDVKPAVYLVRMQVDRAESPLEVSSDPQDPRYVGPTTVIANLLRSTAIQLDIRPNGDVRARITVRDEDDDPVRDATVFVTWTLPDSTAQDQTGDTTGNGMVRFDVSNGSDRYTLEIKNIAKAGYVFDRYNSLLSDSIIR